MGTTLSGFQFDPSLMAGATGNTLSTGGFDLSGGTGAVFNPYTGGSGTGSASSPSWYSDEKLGKALAALGSSKLANQSGTSGGGQSGNAAASSPTGGGRGPSLDALLQLLNQRFQGLYPGGGGGGKGLLGV